jgi:MFS family permease
MPTLSWPPPTSRFRLCDARHVSVQADLYPIGLLLSTGMIKLLSGIAGSGFDSWGWRVPFLLSIVLVGIGRYVRLRVQESPSFGELKRQQATVRQPVWQVIKEQPREIVTSAFVRMSEQAPFCLFVTFVLTYGTDHLGMSKDSLLNDTLVAAAVSLISVRFSATCPT